MPDATEHGTPVRLVVLYHPKDAAFKRRIVNHLAGLERQTIIRIWAKDLILAGSQHEEETKRALEEAEIILFLVSSDSVAAEGLWSKELGIGIQRAEKESVRLIPVLVRHFHLEETPLKAYERLPRNGQPVDSKEWRSKDEPYLEISREISKICVKITRKRAWEAIGQAGELNPEFQELEQSFVNSPDDEVMSHPNFRNYDDQPRSTAHFKIYRQMLAEIRERMEQRTYNFCAGNIEDANKVISILDRVRERIAKSGIKINAQNWEEIGILKEEAKSLKIAISDPKFEESRHMENAIGKYILPFCDEIRQLEENFDRLAANSILDELPPPHKN